MKCATDVWLTPDYLVVPALSSVGGVKVTLLTVQSVRREPSRRSAAAGVSSAGGVAVEGFGVLAITRSLSG